MDLTKFKKDLEDSEHRVKLLKLTQIWDSIKHKKGSLIICYPEWQCNDFDVELFFKEMILNEEDYAKLTERIDNIVKANKSIIDSIELELSKRSWEEFISLRNSRLHETDWTMLPDVEIVKEKKDQYRKYRKFLRKLPRLYKLKVVDTLTVSTFDEFVNSVYININLDLIN